MHTADLVIVGGGLVGASLANAVASHPLAKNLHVILIDPFPPSKESWSSTSLRTSTITPSSKYFLDTIGVWEHIPVERIAVFDRMFVWDHPRPLPNLRLTTKISEAPSGTIVFEAADIQKEYLGYVLDNDTLRNAMYRRMQYIVDSGDTGLQIVQGSVKNITYNDEESDHNASGEGNILSGGDESAPWPVLELESGDTIRCRLIAACDGSRSRVRTLSGADWFQHKYGQSAVVANVCLKEIITTAYQRFVSTGPVAVLPVATEDTLFPVGNVIWTTTPAEANALVAAPDSVFIDELNAVLAAHEDDQRITGTSFHPEDIEAYSLNGMKDVPWNRLARGLQAILPRSMDHGKSPSIVTPPEAFSVLGQRGQFPLTLGHSPRYVLHEKRTVLVGDAAHSVHPLAGQGVNLGFGDAQSLAECIASASGTGRDLCGEMGAPLMRYESGRMISNLSMIGVLHGLQSMFNIKNDTWRDLRRVGISALNFAGPLKRGILRAMR